MSGIKGYPHQDKLVNPLLGYDQQGSKTTSEFVTAHENASKQVLLDMQMHGVFRSALVASTIDSVDTVYPKQVIHSTAHGAAKGDFIRFEAGSANQYIQAVVAYVPDADTMILGSILPADVLITDTFFILKSVMPVYSAGGALSVSSGPIEFIKDAVAVTVTEDTANPANDIPLPVKIVAGGSGSYAEIVNLAAVAQTFTAPAGAVGFILETDSSNTNNVRYKIGAAATTTSGMKMEPGRDTGYVPCAANISVIAEAGTNQVVTVQWILKV